MGDLINFDSRKHQSKVFNDRVLQCLELANVVTRKLREHDCRVVFAGVDGIRPFLVVEADAPMHTVRTGHLQFQLERTPGTFQGSCQTLLLQCNVLWKIRPAATAERVH